MQNVNFIELNNEEESSIYGGGLFWGIAGGIIGGVGGMLVGVVVTVADAVISKEPANPDIIFGCALAGGAIGIKAGAAIPGGVF